MAEPILVHVCCAPCALEPVAALVDGGFAPTLYWSNANIQPLAERQRRLETLRGWASDASIPLVETTRDEEVGALWERAAAPKRLARRERCRVCYALRLRDAADYAADHGFEFLTTTLAVSPYQLLDEANGLLGALAAQRGLRAVGRDWRERYPEATRRARELGLYRQSYCGCRFSAAEAQRERQFARDARRAAKAAARA